MILKVQNRITIYIFLLFVSRGILTAQTRDSSKNADIYRFAEFLYEQKDYERAAGEYLRFTYLNNGDLTDSILFKVANCNANVENWDKAEEYYNHLYTKFPSSDYLAKSKFNIALIHYSKKEYKTSLQLIDKYLSKQENILLQSDFKTLQALNLIHMAKWDQSHNVLKKINTKDPVVLSKAKTLVELSLKGQALKYKSPALAGIMSSVIPGTGKFYTKRNQDALYSLVLVGLMTWQAYDGFNEKGTKSVKGWLYASAGFIFYTGNIYGSVVSARLYNEKLNENIVQNVGVMYKF